MVHRILFHLATVLLVTVIIVDITGYITGAGAAYQLETALWHMLGLVFFAALGIQSFSLFKASRRKMYYVSDTPTSKIGSAAQGYVELKGKLILPEGQAPLLSPLSHTACLWWEYTISERKQTSQYGRSWVSIDSAQSNDAFYMADETGQCRIYPHNATITAHEEKTWEGKQRYPQQKQTDKRIWWKKLMGLFQRYRYTEWFLLPNQSFYALGYFHHKDGQAILEKPLDERPFILSTQEESQVIDNSRSDARNELVMIFISAIAAMGILWHWLR